MVKVRPHRIQRKRTKGWRMQDASPNGLPVVYVGRPTMWGNPYPGKGQSIVDLYRRWLTGTLMPPPYPDIPYNLQAALPLLRGRNLCCWCPLDQPCHADVLLELANRPESEKPPCDG